MKTLILTAIPVEYKAIREKLTNLEEIETPDGTIFEKGIFTIPEKELEVVIGQCGMGNINSAIYTERAIKATNPSLVIFCGIAGGIKDVKLGDVVLASKIYSYEGLKDKDGLQSRPDGYKCTYAIVQRAIHEATTNSWHSQKSTLNFNVLVGPICVGEKVLSDKKSELYNFIKTHYNDSLAVEMESMGFLGAAHSNNFENFAVVRGISDLIEEKETTDAAGFQEKASIHASEFTFALLQKVWKNIKPRIPRAIGMKLSFGEVLNQEQIDEVLAKIKNLTGDMNIELETVTYGSTNLYLKMSEETYAKLKALIETGALKKKIKLNPTSFKQYLFANQELPISFEFNRFMPNTDNEITQIFNFLSESNLPKTNEYWSFGTSKKRINCVIFASYHSDFEFLSANRISLIDTAHVIGKSQHYLKGLDFIRNEAIHHHGSYSKWSTLTSFKRDVKNQNIAIFRSSLDKVYETFYRMFSDIVEHHDFQIYSSITELNKRFSGAEGFVIIDIDQLSEFKNANRLIVDRLRKVNVDEEDDEEEVL